MSRQLKATLLNCVSHSTFPFGTQPKSTSHICLYALWSILCILFLAFNNIASLSSYLPFLSSSLPVSHLLSPNTPQALPPHWLALQAWRRSCSFHSFSCQFDFYGLVCLCAQQLLLCSSYRLMFMMDPVKFCSPERAYPIWKAMILPSSGYFWSKLYLQVLCNSQISFHRSDSELHKSSMSLVASDVNSPFSILLSLSFSWSCRFTGCDRRCMNNHLFMACLTLTHGLVWSTHTWNGAKWMGFLHPLEKIEFKITFWNSRSSGEVFSTCKIH